MYLVDETNIQIFQLLYAMPNIDFNIIDFSVPLPTTSSCCFYSSFFWLSLLLLPFYILFFSMYRKWQQHRKQQRKKKNKQQALVFLCCLLCSQQAHLYTLKALFYASFFPPRTHSHLSAYTNIHEAYIVILSRQYNLVI